MLLAACGGGSTSQPASVAQSPPPSQGVNQGGSGNQGGGGNSGGSGSAGGSSSPGGFDPANFGVPTASANRWLPLKPGTQSIREGFVNVGYRKLPHRVVTTVTDVSKAISGVRTVVVMDQDYNGGQIAEQSLDYMAEDKQGNVWYLGSYTESYSGGQFVNASDAWLDGINGAKAGVLMPADPQPGTPFTEDTVPGVESPSAQVAKTGQSQCVPFKCYKGVLVLEEGGSEYKYFAPGVGQIKTQPLASSDKQEIEDMINLTQLSPAGLARISSEALKLDKHAQVVAPDVFGNAPLAKRAL